MDSFAPLVNGTLSSMGAWIPVHPIDVVKALVQNNDEPAEGSDEAGSLSAIDAGKELFADGGINAFLMISHSKCSELP